MRLFVSFVEATVRKGLMHLMTRMMFLRQTLSTTVPVRRGGGMKTLKRWRTPSSSEDQDDEEEINGPKPSKHV
jgi:hypothetical protein